MNILAIGAHPDDVEGSCGGTLAKYAKQGHKVFTATTTNGNIGSAVLPMEEIAKIRKEEARRAAAIIGAEYLCLDYDDEMLYDDRSVRVNMINLIRYCQPDLIITHAPNDYMPDHTSVSKLVFDAAFTATLPNYPTKQAGKVGMVPIYYMDTLAGVNFNPTEYVDITGYMDKMIEMLECHESQLKWMRDHDGIDFADMVRTCSRYRGYQCGVEYAEGFTMCQVYLKGTAKRLLP